MENIYLLSILCGLVLGAFFGRFITKLKLALVYESRLKEKKYSSLVKIRGGE